MYLIPDMVDMTKQIWPTEDHRVVAIHALIGNGRYHTMSDLAEACKIIAQIPEDKIRIVTPFDLRKLGVMWD